MSIWNPSSEQRFCGYTEMSKIMHLFTKLHQQITKRMLHMHMQINTKIC